MIAYNETPISAHQGKMGVKGMKEYLSVPLRKLPWLHQKSSLLKDRELCKNLLCTATPVLTIPITSGKRAGAIAPRARVSLPKSSLIRWEMWILVQKNFKLFKNSQD